MDMTISRNFSLSRLFFFLFLCCKPFHLPFSFFLFLSLFLLNAATLSTSSLYFFLLLLFFSSFSLARCTLSSSSFFFVFVFCFASFNLACSFLSFFLSFFLSLYLQLTLSSVFRFGVLSYFMGFANWNFVNYFDFFLFYKFACY